MSRVAVLTLIYAGTGALLAVTGLPMWLRWMPPNAWYGFRTARTVSNEQVWYAVNQTAGRDLFVAGISVFLAAIILFIIRNRWPYDLAIMNLIVLIAAVGIATVHSFYALAQISEP
jgi:uncharacterized membrane protein